MFIDKAKINVKAGSGGNGIIAFRREKYVPMGGPSGGDGGRGGSIYLKADEGLATLLDFKYKVHYKGQNGDHGQGSMKIGKSAPDLYIRVPVGTVVRESESGRFLGDLTEHGETLRVAKGGRGGRGNLHFANARNTAPKFAERGEPGEELWIQLELKVLADVGLVGFPNVGKSSLLSNVSAARPKVADYHFTTLQPNLGMVRMGDAMSFVLADIPGLIEGAADGLGLGHDFLRHVERTRLLVHVVDISGCEERDPYDDFVKINAELSAYSEDLSNRPQIVALNKMDLPGAAENAEVFTRKLKEIDPDIQIFPISAATSEGIEPLMWAVWEKLSSMPPASRKIPVQEETVYELVEEGPVFTIEKAADGAYEIHSAKIDKILSMTYVENEAALIRFHHTLVSMGVIDELRNMGIQEDDTVRIGDYEFGFYDEFILEQD